MESQQDLEHIRAEVFSRLGKMIVNLQNLERMLKEIVSRSEIRGDAESIHEHLETASSRVKKMTMGTLIKELLTRSVATEDTDDLIASPDEYALRFRVIVDESTIKELESGLADLVSKRNDLAHHFTMLFDLQTAAGCSAAIEHLNQITPAIQFHYARTQTWVKGLRMSTNALKELIDCNSTEPLASGLEPKPDAPVKDGHTASSS